MAVLATDRRNAGALPWLRGAAMAGVTYLALSALGFYPPLVPPVVAAVAGVLGLLAPGLGVLLFLVVVGVPLMAADILAGAAFLVLGFGTLQYLSESHSRVFLVLGIAFAATLVRAEWGIAVLAGYLLGASEGAVAALVACLVIEAAGILVGARSLGTLATGGARAVVDLKSLASFKDPMTFRWVGASLSRIDPSVFVRAATSTKDLVLLAAQPLAWAGAAALAGLLRRPVGDPKRPVAGIAAVAGSVLALALLSAGGSFLLGGPVRPGAMAAGAGAALAVAVAGVALAEWVFAPVLVQRERGRTAAADDADVDELLRTISSAEETLAAKHTVRGTVLLTDMKSFSRMTEELGSTETAKLVQRHRDLLIPLIEAAGGHGKSTGGDGLLAAFERPAQAIDAAIAMQRALAEHNAAHQGSEPVLIRAGIASGEVVLDRAGKPFLGDALNHAARVMSLADGGQIFTTRGDADASGSDSYQVASHGEFNLKNIAEPVEIIEVLWRQDQRAKAPASTAAE